jgi:NitT/TauT family transport system substrate-binding protein
MNHLRNAIPQLLLSWILVVVLGDPLEAQVRSTSEKFRVVYSAIGSSQSPLWIAHEAGLFRKHGLDVELLYVAGGSRAAQVILSGEVPVAMFNGGSVISADLAGADLVNVASGMNVLPFFLVVGPGVKQIEELKGKKIAVTRLASATDYALRFAAEKWSVKPDRDFAVLQLGGQPEMMAALKSGAVQGAMLNAEFTILARREGYRDLADVGSMGLTFPGSGLNTSRSFIRNRRDTMLRIVRAYTDSVHYGRTQKSFALGVLAKYLKNSDTAFLESVYDLYIGKYIPQVPHPSVEAMKRALDDIAEKDPRARGARPEQFIDASLMQELEKEGFIKQLWR